MKTTLAKCPYFNCECVGDEKKCLAFERRTEVVKRQGFVVNDFYKNRAYCRALEKFLPELKED
jgi:hypothetical protein